MALRCVYTDLDGTLLGPRAGSSAIRREISRSPRRRRSRPATARASRWSSCQGAARPRWHRTPGSWVAPRTSTRPGAACSSTASGPSSPAIGSLTTNRRRMSGWSRRHTRTSCSSATDPCSSGTPRGRSGENSRSSCAARWTPPRLTSFIRSEGRRGPTASSTMASSLPDGGGRGPHARVPPGAWRGEQGQGRRVRRQARGYDPESCIAIGDSIEDLEASVSVGRFFCVANGPSNDDALRRRCRASPT